MLSWANIFNKLNERYGIWNLKITTSNTGKDGRCSVIDEHYTHNSVKDLIESPSTYDGSKVDGLLYIFNVKYHDWIRQMCWLIIWIYIYSDILIKYL